MERDFLPPLTVSPELVGAAGQAKAWPFEEARKLIKRYEKQGFPAQVTFETGYGPSGLPHIGTFGEVARTSMVRHAFHILTQNKVKTRILCKIRGFNSVYSLIQNNARSLIGTSSRMAVIQLINLGITQVLVKLLINLQHADTIMSEILTQDILWILGQVIFKDDAL